MSSVAEVEVRASSKNKWLGFIGIAALSFGAYLDYTVVNIALPTIQQEFQASLISLQWVMNIYFLALCVLATVMGRVGDIYGRRLYLYLGAGIFTVASLLAGFAPNLYVLIIGRLLQGVSAALIFPLSISLVPQLFPEKERHKAVAWFGCIGGIALALGPLLGGIIVTYWGWRWIFFINVPISIIGYLFCFNNVREERDTQGGIKLDIKGMLLLGASLGSIVLGLIYSQNYGWGDYVGIVLLCISIIAAFWLYKFENKQKDPLVSFKDYGNSIYLSGAVLCFLAGVLSAVTLFFDPLYLQIIKLQSPEFSGIIMFAVPIAVFLVAFVIGSLVARLGIINTILVGLILASGATLLQIFFSQSSSLYYIIFAFVCLGSMWAMGNTVPIIAAHAAVSAERKSVATGSMVTLFNIGGSIGITLAVVVYSFVTSNLLQQYQDKLGNSDLSTLNELIKNPAHSLQVKLSANTGEIFNNLFIPGFSGVMIFLFVLSLMALMLVGYKSRLQK